MSDPAQYFDIRSAFWRQAFDQATDYDTYLAQSPAAKADRWRAQLNALPELTADERARLTGHDVRLNVLLVSGVWCGDCVRQGPMLHQLASAAGAGVQLRVIDRDADPAVRDEVRLLGAMRVPVAVFLTEQFFEVGRFGDRMLSTYRRKAVTEVGAACALPNASTPAAELAAERGEWLDIVERMLLMVRLSPITREHLTFASGA
ncbi:MAG: thioredoxin family protein [Acidobacteriota bacterium]|nr:thioredoxin family protein [Acidobacteriota bacterium]